MTAQTLPDCPNFCFVPAYDVETDVQQIRIVIEGLAAMSLHLAQSGRCHGHLRQAQFEGSVTIARGLDRHGSGVHASRRRRSGERHPALRPVPCCAAGPAPSPLSLSTASHHHANQTGRAAATRRRPQSLPARAARPVALPPPSPRQARRPRSRHRAGSRAARASGIRAPSGRPQGMNGVSVSPSIAIVASHGPSLPAATASGPNRTAACATIPAGSQSSASGQNP